VARIYEAAVDVIGHRAVFSKRPVRVTSLLGSAVVAPRRRGRRPPGSARSWRRLLHCFRNSPISARTTLGPYRIEAYSAPAAYDVFSGIDTRLHRRVALKVLPGGVAVDEHVRARFSREAEAVAALAHPHICTLYDVGRHDEVDFLVMEHLEGETLAARLALGPLPYDTALAYATQIAAALDHATARIIHRDLKPANIMLAPRAKLSISVSQFGPSQVRTGAMARSPSTIGRGRDHSVQPTRGIVRR
jgi:hypothetical protein